MIFIFILGDPNMLWLTFCGGWKLWGVGWRTTGFSSTMVNLAGKSLRLWDLEFQHL